MREGYNPEAVGAQQAAAEDESSNNESIPVKKGKLPSQLEVAMRNSDPNATTAEAFDSMISAQQTKEQQATQEIQQKERFIADTAQASFEKRWSQEIPGASIDAMLKQNNIEPWSDEAAQFMAKWDREQAEQSYNSTIEKFGEDISTARAEISTLEQKVKTLKTKSAQDRAGKALVEQEQKLRALESSKLDLINGTGKYQSQEAPSEQKKVSAVDSFNPENWPPQAEAVVVDENTDKETSGFVASPDTPALEVSKEQDEEDPVEKIDFEPGQTIKLPEGKNVIVVKKRWFGDRYAVEEVTNGESQKHTMSGDELRAGEILEEDAGEGSGDEERLAA